MIIFVNTMIQCHRIQFLESHKNSSRSTFMKEINLTDVFIANKPYTGWSTVIFEFWSLEKIISHFNYSEQNFGIT